MAFGGLQFPHLSDNIRCLPHPQAPEIDKIHESGHLLYKWNFNVDHKVLPSNRLLLLKFSDGEIPTLPSFPPPPPHSGILGWRPGPGQDPPSESDGTILIRTRATHISPKWALFSWFLPQKNTGQFQTRMNILPLAVWPWPCSFHNCRSASGSLPWSQWNLI